MKSEKPSIISVIVIIAVIVTIILIALPDLLGLYDIMLGSSGLKNIMLAITLRTISRLIISLPLFISGVHSLILIFRERKNIHRSVFLLTGIAFLTVTVPLILFLGFNRTHFNEQLNEKDINGIFGDAKLLSYCLSDLKSDDYDEFTINNCYVDYMRHISSTGRGGSSYHNEYSARFYYGKQKIKEMQIGSDEYYYLKEDLPTMFDTKITVYKKSGFLRSIEPSVDYSHSESYEHFFTLSVSGDQIIYEKNVDVKFKNIQWSGFKSGKNYDIKNSLFGFSLSEDRPYLDTDYIGLLCEEVCLYATVDGQYRRVSNIITQKDINVNLTE